MIQTKTKSKVLVIDDSLMARKLIVSYLNGDDYEIHEGKNGRDGLAIAAEVHPDLILLDFVMPGMNGYEVYQALRSQPEFAETPVIVFSSSYDEVVKKFGYPFDGFEFLHKHATNDQVLACVESLLHEVAEDLTYDVQAQIVEEPRINVDALEQAMATSSASVADYADYENGSNDIADALASLSDPVATLEQAAADLSANAVSASPNPENGETSDQLLQAVADQNETIRKMGKTVDNLLLQVQQLESRIDKYSAREQSSPSLWAWLMITAVTAAFVSTITGALFMRPTAPEAPGFQPVQPELNNNLQITP